MAYRSIVISSGHGLHVRGAAGVLDEVDEARKVVDRLADELVARGVEVHVFHDDTSTSQNQNLNTIVAAHNSHDRELDVSVHFNAHHTTSDPMGTEVLYVSQEELARDVSHAIAANGFKDRGAKHRTDLAFLNGTDEPAILIETCFVDSSADADIYRREFSEICAAIADVLGGMSAVEQPPPIDPGEPAAKPRIDITITGEVDLFINGSQHGYKG